MHPARLWRHKEGQTVQCRLCSHYCKLEPDEYGKCGVRANQDGSLMTLVYDTVAAMNVDPIEKKPLYHFLPGTQSFSIGTMGCNLACEFCQNDTLSQSPKKTHRVQGEKATPEQIVAAAQRYRTASISYTYSEPTIFFELIQDTAALAQTQGLKNVLVTNGFMSPDCLQELGPLVDAANVDLKAFTDEFYTTTCGARLKPVLQNLKHIRDLGWWLEVTTLIIPGLNDDHKELTELVGFIAQELGPQTPWHISRFHPAYHMLDRSPTPLETLNTAYRIGKDAGLQFVYLGNVSGHDSASTKCPQCGQTVIDRRGFSMSSHHVQHGRCGNCGAEIPGVWLES